jgi:hypothetical protein
LRARITSFDYGTVLKRGLLVSTDLGLEFWSMSSQIVNVTTENYLVPSALTWASRSIMQEVLAKFEQNRLQELEAIIAEGLLDPNQSHDVDGEFQFWSCQRLARGLRAQTFGAEYARGNGVYKVAGAIELPAKQIRMVRSLPVVAEMVQRDGSVHYSKLINEPLCDAAVVAGKELLLLQMTIGKTHGFKLLTWKTYCAGAKAEGLERVRFLFVVPFKDNFRVTREQCQTFELDFGIEVSLEVVEMAPTR